MPFAQFRYTFHSKPAVRLDYPAKSNYFCPPNDNFYTYMKHFILSASLFLGSVALNAQALLPYQDATLSAEKRAEDLVSRLSLEQKVKLMMNGSPAIKEFGIHKFNWWSEALHGSARNGLATVFPQAIGMAASWDEQLVEQVFDIASTEQRIKYIRARKNNDDIERYCGLAVWTPNINIFRDPRWGRGQETYGEDPYLTTRMGYRVVRGLQGEAENPHLDIKSPYDKLHACLKHYAIHSGPEYERHVFNAANISRRDLMETYLYAFERLVKTTDVKEVMCAYNAVDSKPCCGNDNLLTQILRNEWGFQGLVVSDCGAIRDFYDGRPGFHNIFPDAASASANAVMSGTDINCGGAYKALPEAVKRGDISEKDIDIAVTRALKARFEMGDMDAIGQDPWNSIPDSELNSDYNQQMALQMARECMTLLQNRGNALPLDKGKRIAVLGPNANDSITMWGNYNGQPAKSVTVLDAIRQKAGAANVQYRKVSEWVAREEFHSLYSQLSSNGQQGMSVNYWNNVNREGEADVSGQLPSPFNFCTLGNTVFAPGVNLTDFSARFEADYHADTDQTLTLNLFTCGIGEAAVTLGGDTICKAGFRTGHGPRRYVKNFKVKAGNDYRVAINYAYFVPDAQLNFDFGIKRETDIGQVIDETRDADIYVYVGGISPQLEGEEMKVDFEGFKGGDRESIQLPRVQRETLQALHRTGKPVIFVNMSGSAIGLAPEVESCDAILQAWYPGQAGGQAVADVLFGDYNPAGRLPITFYKDVDELPDYHDYNLAGHTYRYYAGKPVFAFGHGLSYSTFTYGKATLAKASKPEKAIKKFSADDKLVLRVPVTNTSMRDGEEVVQLYLRKDDDTDGPIRTLRGFKRQLIPAGQTVIVEIPLDEFNFRTFNEATGQMQTTAGSYTLYYGSSSRLEDLQTLTVGCK